jgi:hypothetical protein
MKGCREPSSAEVPRVEREPPVWPWVVGVTLGAMLVSYLLPLACP